MSKADMEAIDNNPLTLLSLRATCPPRLGRRERGNLLSLDLLAV
ncbi:MAG: hypothetical protein WB564_07175 [Dehalococcoidia bacterium]